MRQLTAALAIAALAVTGCAATASPSSSTASAASSTASAASGPATAATGLGGGGAGPAQWLVHGTFQTRGGSAQPLSGMVTFRDSATGHTVNVTVGASGKFSLGLAAGTYAATGQTGPGRPPCTAPATVTVRAGQPTLVSLTCKAS